MVSLKNIIIWFVDQLTHPSTLFHKRTWGVFSIYAHVRRSDHRPKQSHASKEKALTVSEGMQKKYGGKYGIYKCLYCDGWHVAKLSNEVETKPPSKLTTFVPSNSELDVNKILSLNIPDIAAVYGGVRGRTMSSRRQNFAWPIIREAGVRTIIDLREDGVYSRLSDLCKQYGIDYLYYPVDNRCNHIEEMVKSFSELCRCIDAGNFYIACAMGLHRTDIALCCYWVFHAADKGMAAPPICGYRKSQGHNTVKIQRVLNAMYKQMTETNGIEPIPAEIFNARKKVINELSKI